MEERTAIPPREAQIATANKKRTYGKERVNIYPCATGWRWSKCMLDMEAPIKLT